MIRSTPTSRRRALPALLAASATLLALGVTTAQAAPQTVTGGTLDWSTVKLYGPTAGVDRTFVGFETRNASPGHQNMTLSPALGGAMWGTTVSPASASGTAVSWSFPAIGGYYDAAAGTGTVALTGRLQGVSTALGGSIGFDYTLSIDSPVVVFDGTTTAHLYANGTTFSGTPGSSVAYDRAELFSLNLATMTETQNADGTTTLSNLVPTVVTDIYGGFPAGSGPDRTPNTFGGFSLTIATPQSGPKGADGANGTNGTNGAAGANGSNGSNGSNGTNVTRVIAHLAKAPWPGSKTRTVSVVKRGTVVAAGTVKKKTLTVTVKTGKKVSAGTYTLKAGSATRTIAIG